jgi:DNA replication protein DnaC
MSDIETSPAAERADAAAYDAMRTMRSQRFATVSTEQLRAVLEQHGMLDSFDLTGEWPVAIRRCRGCQMELRFEFEGGVRPGLLGLLMSVACESCAMEEEAAEERAAGARERERRIMESGLPDPLRTEVSWESLIEKGEAPDDTEHRKRAISAARAWAQTERPKKGLLLFGPAGSGKTRLAATAALERLQQWPLRWVSVGVLTAQLDGAWNDDERKAALKVLTDSGTVVLDDFDKIAPTARMRGQLFTALDKREQSGGTLIVTTNMRPSELKETMTDAIVSRLMGMCEPLAYPGPDYRLELGS